MSKLIKEIALSTLKNRFLESGSNMVKIQLDSNGSPNIERYNDIFPFFENNGELITSSMWERLFVYTFPTINNIIEKVAHIDLSGQGSEIKIQINLNDSIDNVDNINNTSFTDEIDNILTYGALYEWFNNAGATDIASIANVLLTENVKNLMITTRKMEAIYLRKPINSPIFDSMI